MTQRPSGRPTPASVTVSALDAGYLTLPSKFFVSPLSPSEETSQCTAPSLSFLSQHFNPCDNKTTRILFDLGIRRSLDDYTETIRKHATTRQPISGVPDTVSSLTNGRLEPKNLDLVVFSHWHWGHIGAPGDYPDSIFLIGPGAVKLISGDSDMRNGSQRHFEKGLLDTSRTIELRDPAASDLDSLDPRTQDHARSLFSTSWTPLGPFPATLDFFGDRGPYIDDASYIYLAGDACHDPRLLSGEKEIATWSDPNFQGVTCCIHSDKGAAERTLKWIWDAKEGRTVLGDVEVIYADDEIWAGRAKEEGVIWPGSL
ncbi:hypothetical protein BDW69DRAFT_200557 [Aspergillus filifer]